MRLLLISLICFASLTTLAQEKSTYTTSGGEWIFSFADLNVQGADQASIIRFTPFLNIQNTLHWDPTEFVGFMTGFNIRNVGFIRKVDETMRVKHRTYNVGVPVGIKVGDLRRFFFFGGYEMEFPFHYKEKTFIGSDKQKSAEWFSKRVPVYMHSWYGGVQFGKGTNLKFKYYPGNFFNQGYTRMVNGVQDQPYAGMKAHMFYISVSFNTFSERQRQVPADDDTTTPTEHRAMW